MGIALWASVAASCVSVYFADRSRRLPWLQRVLRTVAWLIVMMIALTIVWAGAGYAYTHVPRDRNGLPLWNPLWIPRYSGFAAPLLCVVSGCILAATPTRVLQFVAGGAVIGLNLWVTVLALTRDTEMPWPTIMNDLVSASRDNRSVVGLNWIVFPGQPLAPTLPGPYYALVRAAHADVDPPAFRSGDSWPYLPGLGVDRILSKLHYQPAALLAIAASSRNAKSMIVWRRFGDANSKPYTFAGWRILDRKVYVIHSIWTWEESYVCERVTMERDDDQPLRGNGSAAR